MATMTHAESRAQRAKRVPMLVKESLWAATSHPATAGDASALFDKLMAVHQSKGKSHMLYKREHDLHIFHYGQAVQTTARWTPELLLARGLVFRKDSGGTSVVAMPWPKFFNLGEDGISVEELEAAAVGGRVEATSKMDGSLGLLFHHDGAWRVTTKGSFTSDQGVWATSWLRKHVDTTALTAGVTYLVEIIYPANKIVIPYTFSALVLLSAFDTAGRELERRELEEVAKASRLAPTAEPEPEPEPEADVNAVYGTVGAGGSGLSLPALHEADNLEELMEKVNGWPGSEREGVVVRFVFPSGASHRVKIKGAAYSHLHRFKDGFTAKKVHDAASKGGAKALEAMRLELPEEFLAEFDAIVREIDAACTAALRDIGAQWELAERSLLNGKASGTGGLTKKSLAQWTQRHTTWRDGTAISDAFRACMFSSFMLWELCPGAAVPVQPGAWEMLEPRDRRMLLGYVLPTLARPGLNEKKSKTKQQPKPKAAAAGAADADPALLAPGEEWVEVQVTDSGEVSAATKAEKKRAKKLRQKAKKKKAQQQLRQAAAEPA